MGRAGDPLRLVHTLTDRNFTDWLPIFCFVIEHPEGVVLIDTGIPVNANKPVWFPPWIRLVQRAAIFSRMTPDEEIGPQLQRQGLSPKDVRWVILTHLHQDHDGGLHHFRNAEIVIARSEWQAAVGLKGRLAGYLSQRWPHWLSPTLIDFSDGAYQVFPESHRLAQQSDIRLVPTPGHSAGHMSLLLEADKAIVCFAGDTSYTQQLLLDQQIDGVAVNVQQARQTIARLGQFAQKVPTVYLPTHDPDSGRRLREMSLVPN